MGSRQRLAQLCNPTRKGSRNPFQFWGWATKECTTSRARDWDPRGTTVGDVHDPPNFFIWKIMKTMYNIVQPCTAMVSSRCCFRNHLNHPNKTNSSQWSHEFPSQFRHPNTWRIIPSNCWGVHKIPPLKFDCQGYEPPDLPLWDDPAIWSQNLIPAVPLTAPLLRCITGRRAAGTRQQPVRCLRGAGAQRAAVADHVGKVTWERSETDRNGMRNWELNHIFSWISMDFNGFRWISMGWTSFIGDWTWFNKFLIVYFSQAVASLTVQWKRLTYSTTNTLPTINVSHWMGDLARIHDFTTLDDSMIQTGKGFLILNHEWLKGEWTRFNHQLTALFNGNIRNMIGMWNMQTWDVYVAPTDFLIPTNLNIHLFNPHGCESSCEPLAFRRAGWSFGAFLLLRNPVLLAKGT